MDQLTTPRRRLPWGVLVTCVVLALGVLLVYRGQQRAPWSGVAFGALAAVSAFLVGRWLAGSLWGVVMALTLVLHPLYQRWAQSGGEPLQGESGVGLSGIRLTWQSKLCTNSANWSA